MRAVSATLLLLGLLSLVLLTLAGWRWWPTPWWLLASASSVGLALALRSQLASPWLCIGLLALAAVISPMIAIPWLWPCGLHCQGLGLYAQLWGAPTWLWGMLAYTVSACLGLLTWRWPRGAGRWLTPCAIVACAGASLYFLWLSWHLAVLCNHCLAIHSAVLCALMLNPWHLSWLRALTIMALAALSLHAIYHPPQLATSVVVSRNDSTDPSSLNDDAISERAHIIAAAMRMGNEQAPWKAQLVLDPMCPHCRQAWNQVAQELGPLVGSGDLQLRIRLRFNPRLPLSNDLATWTVASALVDRLPHYLPHLIGHSQRVSSEQLQQRWHSSDSPVQLATLKRQAQLNRQAIAEHLQQDQQWLQTNRLLTTATPVLLLHGPEVERRIWSDRLPLQEIVDILSP